MFCRPALRRDVTGASAMLNDNLYARFGKPDYAIALHDDGRWRPVKSE